MPCQLRRMAWRPALSVAAAALWFGLAACGGQVAPPAPQAPQIPQPSQASNNLDSNAAWTALSQSSRVAQATPAEASAPAGPKTMSPEEARLAAPFAFGVPAWAPPGFQLQAQAEVIVPATKDGFASVSLDWQNAQGAAIELSVMQGDAGSALVGAASQSESLQVNGQPAILGRQTGFGTDRLTLSWTRGGLAYRLTSDAGTATRSDLLRMAESVS